MHHSTKKYKLIVATALGILLLFIYGCGFLDSLVSTTSSPESTTSYKPGPTIDPLNYETYKGQLYQTVVSVLTSNGITVIEEKVLDDLTSHSSIPDYTVEEVVINQSESTAVITYHIIPKIESPFSSSEVVSLTSDEIVSSFTKAGFNHIDYEDIYDVDPNNAFEYTEVIINGSDVFSKNSLLPFDSQIKIATHHFLIRHATKININFVGNLVLSKYNVELLVDNETIGEMQHGVDGIFELSLKEGSHELRFIKKGDNSIYGSTTLIVSDDVDAYYKINCHNNRVDVETISIDYLTKLNDDEVRIDRTANSFVGKNVNDVINALSDLGFTNIKAEPIYDIIWGITDTESIKTISINGSSAFARNSIFKKNAEVIIIYHMRFEDDPSLQQSTSNPTSAPTPDSSTIEDNGLLFTLHNDYCSLTKVTDNSLTIITIPEIVQGKKVTAIEKDAFRGCAKIEQLTIPRFINSILSMPSNFVDGGKLFYDAENSSVGSDLFIRSSSEALRSVHVTIGPNVNTIPGGLFGKYAVTIIAFDDSSVCAKISSSAFSSCKYITDINLPSTIESIGSYAFAYCENLKAINIPDNCTYIGEHAFDSCASLKSVTLPNAINKIDKYTFTNCSSLTSIDIPDGVTKIDSYAFKDCNYLVDVSIPSSVKTIEYAAFYSCRINKLVLPFGVEKIESRAFFGCFQLKEVSLPDSIKKLGEACFSGCNQLSKVKLPNGIAEIGEYAFSASNVKEFVIPSSVKVIKKYAFMTLSTSKMVFEDVNGWFAGTTYIDPEELSNPQTAGILYESYNKVEWTKLT